MKKIISIVLTLVFVLSAMASLTLFPSAFVEGDWDTSRRGDDYDEDADSHCPEPGYHYDSEFGFVVDSPDYIKTPYMQAHTKNPVNLKVDNDGKGNSVSLKFRVLDYAYANGENIDQWIAITLNSQKLSTPGNVNYGEGICILIRRNLNGNDLGEGRAQFETFYVDKSGQGGAPKNFALISGNGFGLVQADVPVVDGHEEYTFTVQYTDAGYVLNANGLVMGPDPYLNKILDNACADGAYVSVIAHTAVPGSKISIAINEWQGDIPVGDDKKEPEEDERTTAPIAPSDNIPANEPAVLWSSALRDHNTLEMTNAALKVLENGSIKVDIHNKVPNVFFETKNSVSYEASDFPCVAVLTRNCWANSGQCYFIAGDNFNATEDFYESWGISDKAYADGWALGFIDLSTYNKEGWTGRINGIRVGFEFASEDVGDPEFGSFEIGYIGAFRNMDEAIAYADSYLTSIGVDPDYDPYETTDSPAWETEPITEDAYEETIDEYWPVETETYTLDFGPDNIWEEIEPDTQLDSDDVGSLFGNSLIGKLISSGLISGCNSVIAMPVLALVAIFGAALISFKKHQ